MQILLVALVGRIGRVNDVGKDLALPEQLGDRLAEAGKVALRLQVIGRRGLRRRAENRAAVLLRRRRLDEQRIDPIGDRAQRQADDRAADRTQ
jgi:hypothetical protein